MRVTVKIDPKRQEPEAVIHTAALTDEVLLAQRLLEDESIHGYRDGEIVLMPMGSLLRIYTEDQKVYAQTADGICQLRQRMYVLEELLDKRVFLRISNAEIVNSRAILRMDLSVTGTVGVERGLHRFLRAGRGGTAGRHPHLCIPPLCEKDP